jgi:hypothetical protein
MCVKPEELKQIVDERIKMQIADPIKEIALKLQSLENNVSSINKYLKDQNSKIEKTIKILDEYKKDTNESLSEVGEAIILLEKKNLTKLEDCPQNNKLIKIEEKTISIENKINNLETIEANKKHTNIFLRNGLQISYIILATAISIIALINYI